MEMSICFPGLGLELDYVARSVRIFGLEITIYGILIAVGMFLGIFLTILECRRNHENPDTYLDMMIISLLASVIGARLFYVIFSWSIYKGDLSRIFNTRGGGLSFYGGLLGGCVAAGIFCKIKKLPFWQMADTVSMGILVGQIIGRWGNFFNRESFGEYTSLPLAMQLPLSSVRSGEVTSLMRENLQVIDGVSYIQVHPVFFYESLWCLVILLILLALRRKKRFQGQLFMTYLSFYGLGRFFIENLRTDSILFPGTKICVSMVVSAILFGFFGTTVTIRWIMVKKACRPEKTN
jgi:phosphatidylglycerol:prolipoprotein diacylglycerol transferase